jgi:hypothetical protein
LRGITFDPGIDSGVIFHVDCYLLRKIVSHKLLSAERAAV